MTMILSASVPAPQTPTSFLSNPNFIFCPNPHTLHFNHRSPPPLLATASAFANGTSEHSLGNPDSSVRHLTHTHLDDKDEGHHMESSASALAAAIRKASTSPVEFTQRTMEKAVKNKSLVLPSIDFQRLCLDQLDLFRRIVNPRALLSVYVRPAGSYVMDRLELRRVTLYPSNNSAEIVILICNFSVTTGLRVAEAALTNQKAEFVPECRALVFPMVKHPFVVGFLVAELPKLELGEGDNVMNQCSVSEDSELSSTSKSWDIQSSNEGQIEMYKFTAEQRLNAINISRSIAMAYVMDQNSMLLQQSSWQNNIRMNNLVEQIRGPLSSIRTLSKMLSVHTKRSEVSYDIVEDILVQGDRMRDTLQQLQDVVYLTKSNIIRYNEETLMKMQQPTPKFPQDSSIQEPAGPFSLTSISNELPPLALAPLQQRDIRPCNLVNVLGDLVGALEPLAHNQRRGVELHKVSSDSMEVSVEEPSLRQALSNLIEGALLRTHVGGKVEIISAEAPAGGALVIIDDDGPDMHYMTQTHTLTPFVDLLSEETVEDNMAWNFVAGMTVAREILESYGCVIRVISPRLLDHAGQGGTRVELWLPPPPSGFGNTRVNT